MIKIIFDGLAKLRIGKPQSLPPQAFVEKPLWTPVSAFLLKLLKLRYERWRDAGYPSIENNPEGDKAIRPILELLNSHPAVTPVWSCEGHANYTTFVPGPNNKLVPKDFKFGRRHRNKHWHSFYLTFVVSEEGLAFAKKLEEELFKHPVTVKYKGTWRELPANLWTFEYDTMLNPLEPQDSIGRWNFISAITIRTEYDIRLRLCAKQRFLAQLERVIKQVLATPNL